MNTPEPSNLFSLGFKSSPIVSFCLVVSEMSETLSIFQLGSWFVPYVLYTLSFCFYRVIVYLLITVFSRVSINCQGG